jgi:drug/metabolite transporter (DMT)-like permease
MKNENSSKLGVTDFLMLLAVLVWAVNFSFIKLALREFSPQSFNGPRLALASLLLLVFLWRKEGGISLDRADIWKVVVLGIVGNTSYQLLFINGFSLTTASTTSLIMTMTPIFIALMSALFIRERIHWAGWLGILISFFGLYLILFGRGSFSPLSGESLKGNLMILLGNLFWAAYTVFSKPLLQKISPLKLTTLTLAIGALFYLPFAVKEIFRQPWGAVSSKSWAAFLYSSVLAVAVSYVIWYSSVRRVGNTKTGIFNNITPVFTVFFASLFLHEKITIQEVTGALIILLGFYLTRSGYRWFERKKESRRHIRDAMSH